MQHAKPTVLMHCCRVSIMQGATLASYSLSCINASCRQIIRHFTKADGTTFFEIIVVNELCVMCQLWLSLTPYSGNLISASTHGLHEFVSALKTQAYMKVLTTEDFG